MKGVGKIKVLITWDDDNISCQFRRGRYQESWCDMTRKEQTQAVDAMYRMSVMFDGHIKEAD